jgi:hypothetical protein
LGGGGGGGKKLAEYKFGSVGKSCCDTWIKVGKKSSEFYLEVTG